MTGGAALNLALDPILIFGWFGAPRLELTGAAVAMVVSRLAMSALLFYYAVYRDKLFLPIRQWRENALASWREILAIGLPAMATQMIGPMSGAIISACSRLTGTTWSPASASPGASKAWR